MAQPQQGDSSSSFPSIILVLIMSVGAFWAGKVPLPSSRPSEALVTSGSYAAQQNIDARLWQDPLEAIKKPESKNTMEAGEQAACNDNGPVQIMAVMIGGAPYAEAAETRRRTRYAVLSGLGRSGYVPKDGEHIGLVKANISPSNAGKPIDIPFEWFRYDTIKKSDPSKKRILVLWVNETPIRDRPLAGVKQIVEQACAGASNRETVLIGPSNSGTLRAMLSEDASSGELQAFLKGLRIYSPRATAPDEYLLHADSGGTVASEFMHKAGLEFHRTIATDYALAKTLVEELGRRGVEANDGIALISEWDTTYGRALPEAFIKAFKEKNWVTHAETLRQFSYLRGLDGKLPGDSADKKTETDKKSRDNENSAIETAFGNHQKDYLRRMAARVADLDQDLKNNCNREKMQGVCNKNGVKAVGILGSDVYDKLLILKALRPRFPEVIFFTTDLDAGLLHAEEWDSARNLVVASGYGLRLNGWLQREIPPFRDGYQTAYFLSVLATQMESEEELEQFVKGGTSSPRIFEIGRSQEVDLSENIKNAPHPPNDPPTSPRWYQILLLSLLPLGIWLHQIKRIVDLRNAATTPGISVLTLWVLAGLTAVLMAWLGWVGHGIWKEIFDIGTAGGGEPFSWFEGVSIWPSVLLRAFTGLLALYLLLRGMRHLHKNDEKLTAKFFSKDKAESIFDRAKPKSDAPDYHAAVFIWRDAMQPRPFTLRLFGRLVVGVVLLFAIAGFISIFTSESPNVPYRSEVPNVAYWHWHTLIFAILSFLFLLAFVIDSTHRTCCLTTRLGDHKPTQWPEGTERKWFSDKTSQQAVPPTQKSIHKYQDDWIDIQFIAARTAVVGSFIYYPFLILSLLILARSSFIDNWQIPIGLGLIFAFYLIIAIMCALLLRNAAERARRHALEHISQEIIKALGDKAREQEVEQMKLMKEAILAEHRGAFSSFLHQPWLKALLLPLGSYSGIQLLESLSLINL